jgi:hypothetical protein
MESKNVVLTSSGSARLTRRVFFGAAAGAAAACGAEVQATRAPESALEERSNQAFRIRVNVALSERDVIAPNVTANGDEDQFPNRIGNFSKGMPHNTLAEVDLNAYEVYRQAMINGCRQNDIENVPMGSSDRKFTNPCSAIAFDLQGADSHHLAIPAAPSVQSAEAAGEMVELYWAALLRDIPFTQYESEPLAQAAAAELSKLSVFRGPKVNGRVTPATLLRGFTAGDTVGPYISQFLLKPVPFGAQYVEQRMRTLLPGIDFLTQYDEWVAIQNGSKPNNGAQFDSTRRFIRNGRDLGQWVHIDVLYQAYFNAMLIMLQAPDPSDELTGGGLGVPLNPGNPYLRSQNQEGFGTFGPPGIAAAVAEVSTRGLKAVWYQKWAVHRRLRPEAYGGLVHNRILRLANYPIHNDVLNSQALDLIKGKYGSYLLPTVFPEGSPLHPSYGAGHATVAGACVTMLKALFDESFVIPNPVVPTADGLALTPYTGPDADKLTVGGELNKIAANVAIGRNIAGVHWRSDYAASLRLGESIAISVLRDQRMTYGEDFDGFTFTRFDGTKVTV